MASEPRTGKRLLAALATTAILVATPLQATAIDTTYPPDGENPLRITYYFLAPVGELLEWTVTRPLAVFGNTVAPHQPERGSSTPGCGRERPARSCTNVIR